MVFWKATDRARTFEPTTFLVSDGDLPERAVGRSFSALGAQLAHGRDLRPNDSNDLLYLLITISRVPSPIRTLDNSNDSHGPWLSRTLSQPISNTNGIANRFCRWTLAATKVLRSARCLGVVLKMRENARETTRIRRTTGKREQHATFF